MDINELDAMKPLPIGSGTYEATLHLEYGCPGMKFDYSEAACIRVCSIAEAGSVSKHNERSDIEQRIRVGDFIISINGVSKSPKAMLASMQCYNIVHLTMKRAHEFVAVIAKPPEGLGLNLSCHPHSSALVVRAVHAVGATASWNAKVGENRQIKTNDYIVSVNREFGDSTTLLDAMHKSELLEMIIARPAAVPHTGPHSV
mmetsp:Transcript_113231/g.284710  ORF Transcript_113231/g.284710 Transcript_113231/m.284710 type:complete len:201 (+) Transcript_113231:4-606(+)